MEKIKTKERHCEICNKPLTRTDTTTCSRHCGSILANRKRGSGTAESYKCGWCKQTVKRYPSQVVESGNVYCNRDHYLNKKRGKKYFKAKK